MNTRILIQIIHSTSQEKSEGLNFALELLLDKANIIQSLVTTETFLKRKDRSKLCEIDYQY